MFKPTVYRSNATREISDVDGRETRISNHVGELFLIGKTADTLDEVLIGIPITRNKLAHNRNNLHGIDIIRPEITGSEDLLRERTKTSVLTVVQTKAQNDNSY